jgi:methionyl aminopeptidase
MILKTKEEIEIMAEGGRRLARILKILRDETKAGVTTNYLDERARKLIKEEGAKPAFLGYRPHGSRKPYPATICASVNSGVVHGLPSDYVLKDTDILKIDIGLIYHGLYLDMAITIGIGKVSPVAKKMIDVTHKALEYGIAQARLGNTLGDIGWAIQNFVEKNRFSIVKGLTGHGVGHDLHEDPAIFNFGHRDKGEKIMPGLVIAIEPMVTIGKGDIKQLKDDSFVTADGSLAAHFEHTVAVTEKGPIILTK